MLTHPTLDQLRALRLEGMAEAFLELQAQDTTSELSHPEWLGLLVDREIASRNTRRFQTRMRAAKLRHIGAASKMSTSAPRANWTGPCSSSSPPGAGSQTPAI